jgi:hypothetical protein
MSVVLSTRMRPQLMVVARGVLAGQQLEIFEMRLRRVLYAVALLVRRVRDRHGADGPRRAATELPVLFQEHDAAAEPCRRRGRRQPGASAAYDHDVEGLG